MPMTTPTLIGKPKAPHMTNPTLITLGNTRLYQGDALAVLTTIPDNSIDAICTDPPYGLSKEPDIAEVLTHWLAGDDYTHTGKGFMGNSWDSFVPGPSIWREAFRVLKPGGYAAVFASSRTIDLTTIALRLAGFEVRDTIMWIGAQGFPKSLDVAKALTKAGETELGDAYAGYGTALKPGHEPIALVRKPLSGTVAANVITHGTGGLNIGACRVKNTHTDGTSTGGRDGEQSAERRYTEKGGTNFAPTPGPRGGAPEGRYPINVIFTHNPDCAEAASVQTGNPASTATVLFDCSPDCPVAELDTQSGIRTSGKPGTYKGTPNRSAAYGAESRKAGQAMTGFGDTGGASRFFPTFNYTQKANSKERTTVWVPTKECVKAGHSPDPHDPTTPWEQAASPEPNACPVCTVEIGEGNDAHTVPTPWVTYQHATVKPVAILKWLITLTCPSGGVVLDPFVGTGTTGEAARQCGFESVLVERDPAHVAMVHKRLSEATQDALF